MKRVKVLLAGLCLGAFSVPAQATVYNVDFTISPPFFVIGDSSNPYGTSLSAPLSGSIMLDDTRTGAQQFVGLNYTTGSRTWTLVDIDAFSHAFFSGGQVTDFNLTFTTTGNYVVSNNTAAVGDFSNLANTKGMACNGCVNFTSSVVSSGVPEPATWAMMIVGFSAIGFSIRRKQRQSVRYSFG